ncbi:MAG: hypothetical protein MR443_10890 [Lachnospiraceae bacterium]|nr:hypothetical protein [Lachnospiraceae bacterium]
MKIADLLNYKYISIQRESYSQVFSEEKEMVEENRFFRLAELNVLPKGQIKKVELLDMDKDNSDRYDDILLNGKCEKKILITMKNGEKIELGIA